MNRFQEQLHRHNIPLTRGAFQTLQINVGRKCNHTCTHCHVDAGPHRTEMMDGEIARKVGAWIKEHRPATVDITGGAPELSEFFRYFVETARSAGSHVIDRNNLTIIETKSHAYLPEYLARHEVEVVASLPCYMDLLANRFNPATVNGLMCRSTINIGMEGEVFDCDFNQMLKMQLRNGKPLFLWDITPEKLASLPILTANHCLGCTAGAGSSCGGAIQTTNA